MRKTFAVLMPLAALAALLLTAGCNDTPKPNTAQGDGQIQTEKAFQVAQRNAPYPGIEIAQNPTERLNLAARLREFNKPDKLGFVYVVSFGKPLGYYAIKGKVSSTQSQMTTTSLIVQNGNGGSGYDHSVVPAPGDDLSYGPNEGGDHGVFFRTVAGQFVETSLDWLYTSEPLPFDVPLLNK